MIVSYSDYTGVYGGTVIPSSKWDSYALKANNYITNVVDGQTIPSEYDAKVKLAVCAIADACYLTEGKDGITSESVSGLSQSYDLGTMEKLKYKAMKQYLWTTGLMYRGE